MPLWYNLNDLLVYPAMFLIVIKVLALSSNLESFLIYIVPIFGAIEVAIYLIIKSKKAEKYIAAYYGILLCLSWILFYTYPLLPATYSLFVLYCLLKSREEIKSRGINQK